MCPMEMEGKQSGHLAEEADGRLRDLREGGGSKAARGSPGCALSLLSPAGNQVSERDPEL